MPFYVYKCNDCDYEKEYLQKINDEPIKECYNCKSNNVNKVLTTATFGFKGSGYYCTDFKNK